MIFKIFKSKGKKKKQNTNMFTFDCKEPALSKYARF